MAMTQRFGTLPAPVFHFGRVERRHAKNGSIVILVVFGLALTLRSYMFTFMGDTLAFVGSFSQPTDLSLLASEHH